MGEGWRLWGWGELFFYFLLFLGGGWGVGGEGIFVW